MGQTNRYDSDAHDDYVECPRSRCAARNAPPTSEEFRPSCWKCSADLPRDHPVEVGDELVVEVFDMHESGEGVGRTEDGFVVMVDGVLPEATVKVRVAQILDSYARAELVDRDPDIDSVVGDKDEDDAEDDKDEPSLGSRDNFWG